MGTQSQNPSFVNDIFISYSRKDIDFARAIEKALKNKKLTLSQVEGLDLLINAQSSMAFHQGLGILNGELKKNYLELREVFLKFKASIEINIDFSEDVGEEMLMVSAEI